MWDTEMCSVRDMAGGRQEQHRLQDQRSISLCGLWGWCPDADYGEWGVNGKDLLEATRDALIQLFQFRCQHRYINLAYLWRPDMDPIPFRNE